MQVRADGVGVELLIESRNRLPEQKASSPMPHVEEYSSLAGLKSSRTNAALNDERHSAPDVGVGVGQDVPGAEVR